MRGRFGSRVKGCYIYHINNNGNNAKKTINKNKGYEKSRKTRNETFN